MPRFILKVCCVRDCKEVARKRVHFKIKFQVTSLRTKSTRCDDGGKAMFDESFCFGVPPNPKPSDVCQLTVREDLLIPPGTSRKMGTVEVPLASIFGGASMNKWFSVEGEMSGQVLLQVAMDKNEKVNVMSSGRSRLGTSSSSHTTTTGLGGGGIQPDAPPDFWSEQSYGDDTDDGGSSHDAEAARLQQLQKEIQASILRTNLAPPKADFQSPVSSTTKPEETQVVEPRRRPVQAPSPKPVMRTQGNQTHQLSLSTQEFKALIDRVPDSNNFPSAQQQLDNNSGGTHRSYGEPLAMENGAVHQGSTGSGGRGFRNHNPWEVMMDGKSKGDQRMYPQSMRDPVPRVSPPHVAAMRATSAAWPEDEVEGMLLYCERLRKENHENSIRLARQALTAAKIASNGLRGLSASTPQQQVSPQAGGSERKGGGSPPHMYSSGTPLRPTSHRAGWMSPNPEGPTDAPPRQQPTAQDWFDTFGHDIPVPKGGQADVKTNLEYLYDCL